MSGTFMSTGAIPVNIGEECVPPKAKKTGKVFHLMVTGDFSGRGHRGIGDLSGLPQRKIHPVDRDGLDTLFARLNVCLKSPLSEDPLKFSELDQLHPDYLYENLSIFGRFRALKKKLGNKETFAEAAKEMVGWGAQRTEGNSHPHLVSENKEDQPISLLEGILDGANRAASSETFDVQALVREIVAPYVQDAPNAEQKSLQKAVEDAAANLLRKLMHHRDFQGIESAWRGLDMLLRRIEDDASVRVYVLDVTREELALMFRQSEKGWADSELASLLSVGRQSAGLPEFDAVLADYLIDASEEDLLLLRGLAEVIAGNGARLLGGVFPRVGGCQDLVRYPDTADWQDPRSEEVKRLWEQFRASAASRLTALVCPRYLQRLPYGRKTASTQSLSFEELPPLQAHPYYLWGNGAWVLAVSLLQRYVREGEAFNNSTLTEVDRMPLHVSEDSEGDPTVTPCAEVLMTDKTAQALSLEGVSLIRSVRNGDRIQLPGYFSAHKQRAPLP